MTMPSPERRGRIVIVSNTSWSLVNFRSQLIKGLLSAGYEVVALAPEDVYSDRLRALGVVFWPVPMDNGGTNPILDLLLAGRLWCALHRFSPQIVLGFTAKPNIYGSLAARSLGIPMISNIAGLGAVFGASNWLTVLVRELYRLALTATPQIYFQNHEDLNQFVTEGLVAAERTRRLPGSGVDLNRFNPVDVPAVVAQRPFRFLLVARMLWDKGVGEYVAAARILRSRGLEFECCMLGFADVHNPRAISRAQLDQWMAEGIVRYLGESDDVRPVMMQADCVVLPSYYKEGVPRSLLEAAALERPVITTDHSGCRDTVDDGVTGFLCRPQDPGDLADKMERIWHLSPSERVRMGQEAREKMQREFDEQQVIGTYLADIERLMVSSSAGPPTRA